MVHKKFDIDPRNHALNKCPGFEKKIILFAGMDLCNFTFVGSKINPDCDVRESVAVGKSYITMPRLFQIIIYRERQTRRA